MKWQWKIFAVARNFDDYNNHFRCTVTMMTKVTARGDAMPRLLSIFSVLISWTLNTIQGSTTARS